MSCNGCRVLRKGCNEKCILRQSLSGIESSQAQSNATVFVAKFFGRAGLMSFLSSVPDSQRPALFQSLLFESCGRTVNPVSGAVGLLWTGNWHICQSAVETVLRGGILNPIPELSGIAPPLDSNHLTSNPNNTENIEFFRSETNTSSKMDLDFSGMKSQGFVPEFADLDLCLTPKKRRAGTPNSEESEITTYESSTTIEPAYKQNQGERRDTKLLRLFF